MSSDSDAPRTEAGENSERMDRLRALLTKPIKIPESASSDTEDADYAAPVAAAAAPKGAKTPMTPEATPPKGGAKVPVETPPAVKAAAEALDRLSDEEKDAVVEGAGSGKRSKSRRTWADAYLAKPDKPLTPEEVRAELTVALKEQGAEFRELAAKQGTAQEKALEQALEGARETTSAELTAAVEQAVASAGEEAALLQGRIDELASTADTLRTDLDAARAVADAARAAVDSATTAASAARETADAATKKAATATTFAWVGIVLALVAAVVAVVM